jgi:hypothetical protein
MLRDRVLYRHINAGLIEPPPLLLEAIYTWAKGYLAVTDLLSNKKWLQHLQNMLAMNIEGDSALSTENLKKDIKATKNTLQESLAVVKETKTPIKPWKQVSKKFQITPQLLSGWKYEHLSKDNDVIIIQLINGFSRGNFSGEWDHTRSKMKLTTGSKNDPKNLYQTLNHELIH